MLIQLIVLCFFLKSHFQVHYLIRIFGIKNGDLNLDSFSRLVVNLISFFVSLNFKNFTFSKKKMTKFHSNYACHGYMNTIYENKIVISCKNICS